MDDSTLEEDADTKTERTERAFLRMTVPYLMPGGVLVYIIPQSRLGKSIARMLAYRFERIKVFRFPDLEHNAFKQIIVFGVRRSRNTSDENEAAILERVTGLELPPLGQAQKAVYDVPRSEPLRLFRSTIIDPGELQSSLDKSPLWNRFHEATTPRDHRKGMITTNAHAPKGAYKRKACSQIKTLRREQPRNDPFFCDLHCKCTLGRNIFTTPPRDQHNR